ncbi:MAG: carbohydrate porin [Bacteroidales bacterium]|nr:carbohydrate porin [Bacteroidales bacterium]
MKQLFMGLLCFLMPFKSASQENEQVLAAEAIYTGDFFNSFFGGTKQGFGYMGLIDLSLSLDLNLLGLKGGGAFSVNIQNTHGRSLTGEYVGDIQTISNIDNRNAAYLYQLFYARQTGKVGFLIGKHDLNSEFIASDLGGEYVNSSFGIMPAVSMNLSPSIFPKTSAALVASYQANDQISIKAAVYDGNPLDLETDPYGLDFKMSKEEGFCQLQKQPIPITKMVR